jgi:hypothetical protein|tara:strand:+ start:156 stop:257 length:102 start_codon:yes stop_codon:yes gene_type:complete
MEHWITGYAYFLQGHVPILPNLTDEFQLGGLGF